MPCRRRGGCRGGFLPTRLRSRAGQCTFLSQYAAKNKVGHPSSVYLREKQLLPKIDEWLSRKFDPIAFTAAVRKFEAAHPDEPEPDEGAQQEIAECDAKLARHRAARCRSSPGK